MKVYYGNVIEEVNRLILNRAKYQKVMIVYDDFVSTLVLNNLYSIIKDVCIYNNSHINNLDHNELNNGYKMVVYFCMAESYLEKQIENKDFVNVFCPQDEKLLPFVIDKDAKINESESYLLLERKTIDVSMISSLYCNHFINYIQSLINCEGSEDLFAISSEYKVDFNIESIIEKADKNMVFLDCSILKKYKLDYEKLALLDLILIDAFLVLINSIKTQSLMIVDIYKAGREDYALIDKCFSVVNNDILRNIVLLNYNNLIEYCEIAKQNILDCVSVFTYSQKDYAQVVESVKQYAKQSNEVLSVLYTYNIFGV